MFFRNVENEITDYTCGMAISQAARESDVSYLGLFGTQQQR